MVDGLTSQMGYCEIPVPDPSGLVLGKPRGNSRAGSTLPRMAGNPWGLARHEDRATLDVSERQPPEA